MQAKNIAMRELFNNYDTDYSNRLDQDEFQKMLNQINDWIPYNKVYHLYCVLEDGKNGITFRSFEQALLLVDDEKDAPHNKQKTVVTTTEPSWSDYQEQVLAKLGDLKSRHQKKEVDLANLKVKYGETMQKALFFSVLESNGIFINFNCLR